MLLAWWRRALSRITELGEPRTCRGPSPSIHLARSQRMSPPAAIPLRRTPG